MFNPAKAADEIKKEYIGYINTTFHFRNQNLQKRLLEELDKTVSNGPYVEIKDSFKYGRSIDELIDNGILSPLFRDLEKGKKYIALFDELASYPVEELAKPVQNIGKYRAEVFEAMDLIIQGY